MTNVGVSFTGIPYLTGRRSYWIVLSFLLSLLVSGVSTLTQHKCVAVIGTTGRLGRETIQQLSQQGIATRCLLRHDISAVTSPSSKATATLNDAGASSKEVAAYLATLPGVELVPGDINDPASLTRLLQGTTACLALHGPVAPRPWFRSVLLPSLLFPETAPAHPKQLNYVGMRNLLEAMQRSDTCKHLVRVSGKGESPWSMFSILLNVLGGMAKGWNYEGEQLIRTTMANSNDLSYTIVRPGMLAKEIPEDKANNVQLGYRDNGLDLPVTVVSYQQIANLIATVCLTRANFQRATVTTMNVSPDTEHAMTMEGVQPDKRTFPDSLIAEHKKAARVGGLTMLGVGSVLTALFANLVSSLIKRFLS